MELIKGHGDIVMKMNLKKLADDYLISMLSQSKLSSSRNYQNHDLNLKLTQTEEFEYSYQVKANIFVLLGTLCRYHPEIMAVGYADKCLSLFMNALKAEVCTFNLINKI